MLNLKIGEKELSISFGYEATLKTRLLSKLARMTSTSDNENGDFEQIEDILLTIPEILLIGLQKHHSNEYGFNLDTKEGYEESLSKAFSLVAEYLDNEENDAFELFNQLQEEMTSNGFLKKMFEGEVKKQTQKTSNKK